MKPSFRHIPQYGGNTASNEVPLQMRSFAYNIGPENPVEGNPVDETQFFMLQVPPHYVPGDITSSVNGSYDGQPKKQRTVNASIHE